AVALLVAGSADAVERHGVGVGRGLGLLDQHAGDAPIDGRQRLPTRLALRRRRFEGLVRHAGLLRGWRGNGFDSRSGAGCKGRGTLSRKRPLVLTTDHRLRTTDRSLTGRVYRGWTGGPRGRGR